MSSVTFREDRFRCFDSKRPQYTGLFKRMWMRIGAGAWIMIGMERIDD